MTAANTDQLSAIIRVVWGDRATVAANVNESVFSRWCQGFVYSLFESMLLEQFEGGPCGVIAPVQAHIFKHMLINHRENWQQLTASEADHLLCLALAEILGRIASSSGCSAVVRLVETAGSCTAPAEQSASAAAASRENQLASKRNKLSPDGFHSTLRIRDLSAGCSLLDYFRDNLPRFRSNSGIIQFLYSVIATKGVEAVYSEMCDSDVSLIDSVHGHGSQCLTNLMLTGRAVGHVWDDSKHIAGMALEGVCEQPQVGFLTVLERLHYCTVGWNLKHPLHPVWITASETHLSVIFSACERLVRPASERQMAARRFDGRDADAAGFIPADQLAQLLADCQLEHADGYVQLMLTQLDPDRLGVVLRSSFLDEFFPAERGAVSADPDSFTLFHCNALAKSNVGGKVRLRRGDACLLECDASGDSSTDPLLTCLQSRWPRIDVRWHPIDGEDFRNPSLN